MQIFAFFGLFTNFFVSLAMMYAAVSVLSTTTGADIYALAFIIPIGVSAYAIVGGLKVCTIALAAACGCSLCLHKTS